MAMGTKWALLLWLYVVKLKRARFAWKLRPRSEKRAVILFSPLCFMKWKRGLQGGGALNSWMRNRLCFFHPDSGNKLKWTVYCQILLKQQWFDLRCFLNEATGDARAWQGKNGLQLWHPLLLRVLLPPAPPTTTGLRLRVKEQERNINVLHSGVNSFGLPIKTRKRRQFCAKLPHFWEEEHFPTFDPSLPCPRAGQE